MHKYQWVIYTHAHTLSHIYTKYTHIATVYIKQDISHWSFFCILSNLVPGLPKEHSPYFSCLWISCIWLWTLCKWRIENIFSTLWCSPSTRLSASPVDSFIVTVMCHPKCDMSIMPYWILPTLQMLKFGNNIAWCDAHHKQGWWYISTSHHWIFSRAWHQYSY